MKSFNRIMTAAFIGIIVIIISANLIIIHRSESENNKEYLVEINRITNEISLNGYENIDPAEFNYVNNVEKYTGDDFYKVNNSYAVREINGELYRFDYVIPDSNNTDILIIINIAFAVVFTAVIFLIIYIRINILLPFEQLKDVPYELSKGNLTIPLKENKNRFFGKFVWGINILRENIEQQKKRELDLHKDRKTLLLSLSHDIKTPLSAIMLYAKALSKGLYTDKEKQLEIADNINDKAKQIEEFVSQIINASRDDFLSLDVNISEFYLSELIKNISDYYYEKLSLIKIDFTVDKYSDCLIKGDIDRGNEVLQNLIENAVKYGDGKFIGISFGEEDDCILVSVKNSGCTLSDIELPHIFDSFWRGSNSANKGGSGLGLYICRQIMNKMNGDIFAEIKSGYMTVTAVFNKA